MSLESEDTVRRHAPEVGLFNGLIDSSMADCAQGYLCPNTKAKSRYFYGPTRHSSQPFRCLNIICDSVGEHIVRALVETLIPSGTELQLTMLQPSQEEQQHSMDIDDTPPFPGEYHTGHTGTEVKLITHQFRTPKYHSRGTGATSSGWVLCNFPCHASFILMLTG